MISLEYVIKDYLRSLHEDESWIPVCVEAIKKLNTGGKSSKKIRTPNGKISIGEIIDMFKLSSFLEIEDE